MIPVPTLANKQVAVMGLGIAGLATARALQASGAEVLAWDDTDTGRNAASDAGITIRDLTEQDWSADLPLVLSPGIPHTFPAPHPVAAAARAAGAPIICDVELLAQSAPDADYVAITGTNGKSTTTALIGHILESAGRRVEIGGNLGPPVLGLAPLFDGEIYVLELSSYQLERTFSLKAQVAILLNISEDHLDRHGGLDGYVNAKRRVLTLTAEDATVVVGVDDPLSADLADDAAQMGRRLIRISGNSPIDGGIGVLNGLLRDDTDGSHQGAIDLVAALTLRGAHNHQNAAAAWAACRALGIAAEDIAAALLTFPGLPHRQEVVGTATANGRTVTFINDSKATNVDSAARALAAYDNIFWIAGGQGKDGGYRQLDGALANLRAAFVIGQDGPALADHLAAAAPGLPLSQSETLDRAVADAWAAAQASGAPSDSVILLSPACASFDQFPNFGARGDAFRAAAENLIAGVSTDAGGPA